MSEISTIGLDLAKNVFQVHGVDRSGAVVLRRQLRRGAVEKFFAQLSPCTVGVEACGTAHHWARVIGRYGHQVRLMPPAYVKPYLKRNKNDGRDAEAICEAVSRPTMRFVAVKSIEQQATLAVHTTRALLVRQRTMIANSLRAALGELGIVAAPGFEGLRQLMTGLEAPNEEVPEIMRGALLLLAKHWQALDADERVIERQITKAARADGEARRLMQVPCVGPIIASTVLAKVPDARVPQRTQFRGLDRTDRPRSRHRRQASAWAYLQAGGPHAAGAADHWSQCLSAPAANARRQRSVAAGSACAPALQGRHGGTRRQDRAYHLGHAGEGRTVPRSRERAGCCLVERYRRFARGRSNRKGNYGVMAKWSGNRDRNTPRCHRA